MGKNGVAATCVVALALAACAPVRPGMDLAPSEEGHLITAERIVASGAVTAWDVIKRESVLSTQDSRDGGPGRIWQRGHGTILLNDAPLVSVDGVPQSDFHVLGTIPAITIDNIRILDAREGTVLFGIKAGGGAILIQTRLEVIGSHS